jgi:dipeptidyl aminopeptidase/acylaminoacyl peptidase
VPTAVAASAATISVADYTRAVGLAAKYEGLVVDAPDAPNWIAGGKFTYRKSTRGGHVFVVVDPATLTKKPAFDHARLAAGLSAAAMKMYTATNLPFTTFAFTEGERGITFTGDESIAWTCVLADYTCTKGASAPAAGGGAGPGRGAGGGGRAGGFPGRGGQGANNGVPGSSPDGKLIAFIRDNNIYVRAADAAPDTGTALSTTGTADRPFAAGGIRWSPDSTKIAASRVTVPAERHMVRYVESSPADQVQPKTFERNYPKPGDVLEKQERILIDVAARRATVINPALFDNPYTLGQIQWRADSRAFTFDYNQRGHQVVRVIEVNASTGVARALIEESVKTFVDYRTANGNLTDSGRSYRLDMKDGNEILWMSERDGWAHLYLYDGTGAVKQQITKGNWLVRSVLRVDEAARQIYFMAGGMNPKQDPYFAQYYRINFDGTGLTPLTDADGNHSVSFSPDNQFYVDTWSRVDLPPVSQLRRVSDQKVVMDLEKADATALMAAGWKAPEIFTAKGRDGATDIWGIIIRPSRFDPARKYPVIENIYAGPHGSFVPKSFSSYYGMQALAEIGFIVVQIDGMGTANRSKAFHDVAFKNIKDAGFPDRISWHKAVAQKYPASYDITRVGIYGGSAGGQNSLGGMLFHPEFYKAAASFAGCHDNRMDKIWWNEHWMSWPIGPEYAESSNVVNAHKLQGKLLLVVGELDTNVDPSSTMQVVNALIKAGKQFDLLVMPGEDHPAGRRGASAPYGDRKMWDFFVTNLIGAKTPNWNSIPAPPARAMNHIGDGGLGVWGMSWDHVAEGWQEQP